MPLCIYAVVPSSSRRLASRGSRGEPLSLVRAGRLAAVVGVTTRAPRPGTRTLRDYHRAIEGLSDEFDALLPVRFGTIVRDEEEIRLVLHHRQAALRAALVRVRRRVQMTLRFVAAPDPSAEEASLRDAALRERASGSAYLRSRAAVQRLREGGAERTAITRAVRRYVRAERVDRRGDVISVYHLLPRSAVGPYLRALRAAAATAGNTLVTFTVTGPFPPFAFAEPLASPSAP